MQNLPLIGVWVSHKGGDLIRMAQQANVPGALGNSLDMVKAYLRIPGNDTVEVREFAGGGGGEKLLGVYDFRFLEEAA